MKQYLSFRNIKRLRLIIILFVLVGLIILYAGLNQIEILTCQVRPISDSSALEQPLKTILTRHKDVFAFTEIGFYRGSFATEKWEQLTCPGLPLDGKFANQPKEVNILFYVTTKGLYRSQDDGSTWILVDDSDNFGRVFLHPNSMLYAIKLIHPYETHRLVRTNTPPWFTIVRDMESNRIIKSANWGETWDDITTRSDPFYEILQDPVHPDLVILIANMGTREGVFYAENEDYQWQLMPAGTWFINNPRPTEYFLNRLTQSDCAPEQGTDLRITLGNYFFFKRENHVVSPRVALLPEQDVYVLHPTDPKTVQLQLVVYAGDAIQLLENLEGLDFWGLRLVDSVGQQHQTSTLAFTVIGKEGFGYYQESPTLGQQYRQEHTFDLIEVGDGSPYSRIFDLDDYYGFGGRGLYQVQIYYDNRYVAHCEQGEWTGSITSSTFTVMIEE